mmetsp:Transcript_12681/g.18685  ORF Transcript_12681/g.18685 Transcript_12681/m.18685 type:complete len:244 (-) Transcript_12681:2150-2881(-)
MGQHLYLQAGEHSLQHPGNAGGGAELRGPQHGRVFVQVVHLALQRMSGVVGGHLVRRLAHKVVVLAEQTLTVLLKGSPPLELLDFPIKPLGGVAHGPEVAEDGPGGGRHPLQELGQLVTVARYRDVQGVGVSADAVAQTSHAGVVGELVELLADHPGVEAHHGHVHGAGVVPVLAREQLHQDVRLGHQEGRVHLVPDLVPLLLVHQGGGRGVQSCQGRHSGGRHARHVQHRSIITITITLHAC